MAIEKKRLDVLVNEQLREYSRSHIQSLIMQGKVRCNDQVITKAGTLVPVDVTIVVDDQKPKYASRAGFKLEHALESFNIDPQGMVVLDAGISTGGFTSCLLDRGVARVYGVDVGVGQVHESVTRDPRLVLMEKTNLRHLAELPELLDLATLDLSFISLHKVLPAVINLLKPTGSIIALIKPQFEAKRHEINRGGIVKDEKVRERVVQEVCGFMAEHGYKTVGVEVSPIVGASSGNTEYLAYFVRQK